MINDNKVRSTSKQGERTLIRLVKQDRRRSLRDLMNKFNPLLPVPICKRSIQRRLSKNGFDNFVEKNIVKDVYILGRVNISFCV
jgi:hypothetical protein